MSKNNLVVDREKLQFRMWRDFEAPRASLWKAWTDPELIPKFWGPRYLTTVVERMDVKVGGAWRFIQTDADGSVHAFNGVYKEVQPVERLAYTFEYEPMAGHISTDTITFEELPGGRSRMITVTTFDSLDDLEGMLQSGMESGAVETWERLDELLRVPISAPGRSV